MMQQHLCRRLPVAAGLSTLTNVVQTRTLATVKRKPINLLCAKKTLHYTVIGALGLICVHVFSFHLERCKVRHSIYVKVSDR